MYRFMQPTAVYLQVVVLLLLALLPGRLAAAEAEIIDGDKISRDEFLAFVRQPPFAATWTSLSGTVNYKARGADRQERPIQLRVLFAPDETRAQLIFNQNEWYLIKHKFAAGAAGTSITAQREAPAGAPKLADVGLRPADMTLAFLYWDCVEELPRERVKTQACRVFRLRQPQGDEHVIAAITTSEFFPLRVTWFRGNEKEPYREILFSGIEKVKGLWTINEVRLTAKDWKTTVAFDRTDAGLIDATHPAPADLFLDPAKK